MTTTLPTNTSGTTTTGSTSQAVTTAVTQKSSLSDMNDFMRLFLTQLKHQDPTAPMDVQESMSQLAQFAQVEQLTKLSTKLDSLYDTVQGQAANHAQSYIGREVRVQGSGLSFDGTNPPSFSYDVPADSRQVMVEVVNDMGSTVRSFPGSTSLGKHEAVWDGRLDGGQVAPVGNYTLRVTATVRPSGALESTDKTLQTNVSGRVDAVEFEDGKPWLIVGGERVSASKILSIRAASSPTVSTTPATNA